MSINLLKSIQENLGLSAVKKIDPNTQRVKTDSEENEHTLTQATLTAVLAGIFNISRAEEGLKAIDGESFSSNWAATIFGENKNEIIKNIMSYSAKDEDTVTGMVNKIAAEAIKIIRENITGNDHGKQIRNLVSAQRDFILPYLPASLGLGKLLDDNTLDDATNKMEGPLSSLMHKIEKGFSGSETEEEANRK
ncbi:MAG: hypothetical protein ABJA37_09675 [Ferruginibacter sp.]